MSWGDGQYYEYCARLGYKIIKNKVPKKQLATFLRKRYRYVRAKANVEIADFLNDMHDFLDMHKSSY